MNPNPQSASVVKMTALFALLSHLETELQALMASAKAAHLAATHEESRAEDKHDTFAIEAGYLAAGQASRVAELKNAVEELRRALENSSHKNQIEIGSLVTLKGSGKISRSLLAHHGGGTRITLQEIPLTIVSPLSPLGESLMGLTVHDEFEVESKSGISIFTVMEID